MEELSLSPLETPKLTKVEIVDISGLTPGELNKLIRRLQKKGGNDCLYICTTMQLEHELTVEEEGSRLVLTVKDVRDDNFTTFMDNMINARDYFFNLTIEIRDETDQNTPHCLEEDIVVSKE